MGQLLFVVNSPSGGVSANLQATYDVGPNGLIVTDATGPFGIDNLRFEDEVISAIDGTTGAGSILELSAGNAGTATPISPNGGGVVIGAGDGGDATGGANTAGNGGDVSISAGSAGQGSAGASQGIAGPVNISGGLGGAGTGGLVNITSGNGTVASGAVGINTALSNGSVGLLSITGGNSTTTTGGSLDIEAGASTATDGGSIGITGGQGSTNGGTFGGAINIEAGSGHAGGDLNLDAGDSTDSGNGGQASVTGGDSTGSTGGAALLLAGSGPSGGETRVSSGQGTTAVDAGIVRISLARGVTDTSGGLTVTPTDGHVTLKTYPTDDVVPTGSLILHVLDEAGESAQSPFGAGMIHYRSEQGASTDIRVGFRGSKENGAIGLMARVYSLPFANADLVGAVLTVTHNLGTAYPLVQIYDNGNANVPIGLNVISIVATSINVTTITFGAPVLPLAGTWGVTIVGI